MKSFVELTHHALDSGINFFDSADIYGSHIYFREALKEIPRDKVVILSKMWTQPNNWMKIQTADEYLKMFLKELGTSYIDILLLHCMVKPNWQEEMADYCMALEKARENGLIRAHGVSCHTLSALQAAVKSDWVQILLARINPTGVAMDDKPEVVMPLLKEKKEQGAGIVGMKIYGEGRFKTEEERQKSLEYVWRSGNVHAMTIGFEQKEQIDDTIQRSFSILKG
jgi:predicted aldo/keto reductase-like oxidoreductase